MFNRFAPDKKLDERYRQVQIDNTTSSWWVNQSRESFTVRAKNEQARIQSSNYGKARWETTPDF